MSGEDRDPNVIAYLNQKLHLDEPLPVRYGYWLGALLHGDLGESIRIQRPVLDLILEKLPVTLQLASMAIVIAILIGVSAAGISAVQRDNLWGHTAHRFSLSLRASPN